MKGDIELKRLRHFVLLAEECNFTRAAARANLSQTAFSRSIQTLENRLNIRVFDRGTRSVKLTAAGQQLFIKARQLLRQAQDLERDMEGIANADGGELSFGASLMAVDGIIDAVLPKLMNRSPKLIVNLEVNHWRILQHYLETERIEFFVSYPGSLKGDSKFDMTSLPAMTASVFCRQGHPLLSREKPPSPDDLPNFRWAAVQLRGDAHKRMERLFSMSADTPLPLALTCNNLSLLRQTMLNSDMLLFTWTSWLQADVEKGRIIDVGKILQPSLPKQAWELEFAIVSLKNRSPSPAAQRMIDLIQNAAHGYSFSTGAGDSRTLFAI